MQHTQILPVGADSGGLGSCRPGFQSPRCRMPAPGCDLGHWWESPSAVSGR